jgi:hypothetical protein
MLDRLFHFWINRESDLDRRARAQAYFAAGGVRHQRIRAIVPETLPEVRVRMPMSNSRPELAIFSSHLDAVAAAFNTGQPALIMEDDVRSDHVYDAAGLLAAAPPDWEVLQLHVSNAQVIAELGELFLRHGVRWYEWEPQCFSAGAYVIHPRAAERMLREYRPAPPVVDLSGVHAYGKLVADHLLYRRMRTYCTTIPLFYSDMDFASTHAVHRDSTWHQPGLDSTRRVMQNVTAKAAQAGAPYPYSVRKIALTGATPA